MTEQDLYNPVVISIPEHFTTANYRLAAELISFKQALLNSTLISLTIAALQIAMCTLVGYGFARFEFPLKKFWFACVILVILIPPQARIMKIRDLYDPLIKIRMDSILCYNQMIILIGNKADHQNMHDKPYRYPDSKFRFAGLVMPYQHAQIRTDTSPQK